MLGALVAAGVRFVMVGAPEEGLAVAVSRHPTNLGLLGSVLESMGARVREDPAGFDPGPRRAFSPLGIVWVSSQHGDLALLFGSPGESAYSVALDSSVQREVSGYTIRWVEAVPKPPPSSQGASRGQILGKRLLSLADVVSEYLGYQLLPPEDDENGPTV